MEERLEEQAQELRESLAHQSATRDILRVIAGSLVELTPVLNAVAENAASVCGADDAIIFLVEDQSLRIRARYAPISRKRIGAESPPPIDRSSPPGRAIIDGQTIHVEDLPAAVADFPHSSTRGIAHGVRSALAAPLLRDGVPIGVIHLCRTEVRPFSDKQIGLLKTFADEAVIAIENVRLFQQLQARNRELTESLTQQTVTSEILRVIASSPTELKPVLDTVAENATRVCDAEDAIIFLVANGTLRIGAKYGPISAKRIGEEGPPLDRDSPPGRAIVDGHTIHVEDLSETASEFPQSITRGIARGVRSTLAVPMLRERLPIGVILIRRTEVRPFSDKQIALLKTFADQAVIAIENVRLFHETQDKNQQLQIANERLQELDRLKSDFVANVSHELRTPLTAIKGAVDLVLREVPGPLSEKQMHYLTRVRSNTQHLAGLINDLLDLSKVEEGKIELQAERISLGGVIYEVIETLRPVAAEKSIELAVTLEASVLVWADPDKVTQVLTNLIGNAIKFTPPQGRVVISSTSKPDEWVRVSVSDTGPGISTEEREKIFDKFYQIAPRGESKPKGTGLGLAISKSLVELHGGKIWVESEHRGGSIFHFTLPARLETKPAANTQ